MPNKVKLIQKMITNSKKSQGLEDKKTKNFELTFRDYMLFFFSNLYVNDSKFLRLISSSINSVGDLSLQASIKIKIVEYMSVNKTWHQMSSWFFSLLISLYQYQEYLKILENFINFHKMGDGAN
ncbi:hypothetical protein BpHYR1_031064 [Brachionus plicatilis]|uniref:Uncharacterized protein n=1 Tax=Brachionus plicatilis TaxID=10195 RepID=A0A3M7RXK6_BRAPC|nr:hypothetical protein BpHYR1_031064 [Brachionus plicatilis]